jgi:hypothetical protein
LLVFIPSTERLILFRNPRCSNTFILRLTLLSDVSQSLAILAKLGQHSPLLLALFARAINTSFANASPTLASQASNKYLVALVDVLSITVTSPQDDEGWPLRLQPNNCTNRLCLPFLSKSTLLLAGQIARHAYKTKPSCVVSTPW